MVISDKRGRAICTYAFNLCLILCIFIVPTGCQSLYFSTMEKIGLHKRDILIDRVGNARNAQEDAKEQFRSALEKFSAVLDFQGGKLQDVYEELRDEFQESESKAQAVKNRIDDVEDVAEALFEEWQSELKQYSNDRLRRSSKRKFVETKKRYEKLIGVMKKAEASISPVLSSMRDQVLFLKHNLNAKAIASLQNEVISVKTDIAGLIREMERSIAEADKFIASLSATD